MPFAPSAKILLAETKIKAFFKSAFLPETAKN